MGKNYDVLPKIFFSFLKKRLIEIISANIIDNNTLVALVEFFSPVNLNLQEQV